jgi:ATP-grasp domain, R2K clade family 3
MVNWIVEDGVFGSTIAPLVTEIQAQKHQVKVIDYVREITDYEYFFPAEECILLYGSLYLAERILGHQSRPALPWIPGIIGTIEHYYCTHYYPFLSQWLLNNPHYILPLDELSRRIAQTTDSILETFKGNSQRLFIRPDSPLKPFPGGIYSCSELADLEGFMKRHYLETPEMLVVAAPETQIEAEWRVIIAERRVLTASQYKQFGKPFYQPGMPDAIQSLAETVSECGWQPDPIWVLDLCLAKEAAYVLEINFLSCSAFYQCDLHSIVKEASMVAQTKWNEAHKKAA